MIETLGDSVDLVVTLDDSRDSRTRTVDVLRAAELAGARSEVAATPSAAYSIVERESPTLVLVAGWYWLIPDEVLAVPTEGFVGVHYSHLPSYRGSAPVVWALINGDREVGYSIFKMTSGMDEGPIASQGSVEVTSDDTIASVLKRLDEASMSELHRVLDGMLSGALTFKPQEVEGVSYAAVRRPSDGAIDWRCPAAEIERFVRAQTRPYPGAFGVLDGTRVTVWAAHAELDARYFGRPGQVLRMLGSRPVVSCGADTALVLDEIEAEPQIRWSLASTRFDSHG